jgi:hypothetical protein
LLQDTVPESIYILLLRYYRFYFMVRFFYSSNAALELNTGQHSAILHYLSPTVRLEE